MLVVFWVLLQLNFQFVLKKKKKKNPRKRHQRRSLVSLEDFVDSLLLVTVGEFSCNFVNVVNQVSKTHTRYR